MPQRTREPANRTAARLTLVLAAIVTPLATTGLAHADVTCGEVTCGKGYVCNSYESSGACPAIATADGKPVDCPTTATTIYQCELGPCSSDADCGDEMLCHAYTTSECGGATEPACDPAASDCTATKVAAPPTCASTTAQQCTPRYLLPCKSANDCGAGFNCEEEIYQSCSGATVSAGSVPTAPSSSGSSGSGSGGATGVSAASDPGTGDVAQPDASSNCTATSSGNYACVLQTIDCMVDSDCPNGMTCVQNGVRSCWASSDGTSACDPVVPAMVCQPPNYYSYATSSNKGETQTAGGVDLGGAPPTRDGSSPETNLDDSGDGNSADPAAPSVSGSGCSVAGVQRRTSTQWLAILFSLGLVRGVRRRRSHE